VLPDTIAPFIRLTNTVDGQVFSDNTTIITGVIDDVSASANLTVEGGSGYLGIYPVSGNFSQPVQLTSGNNTIRLSAIDSSGNYGCTGRITVVVNPNKPTVTITQPLEGAVINNPSVTANGTISGNVTSAILTLNGVSRTISVVSGNFSETVSLTEGTNILAIKAYPGGHEGDSNYLGTSGARTVKLDTTPPVVTIDYPMPGMTFSNAVWPQLAGSVNDPCVSTVNITFNSTPTLAAVIDGRFNLSAGGLSPVSGNNTITVTATDGSGNSATANVTIIYDSTHVTPEVRITLPGNNLFTNTTSQNVTGTLSDASITSATLYVNGSPRVITATPSGA
jgi:hypothetical protein